MDSRTPGAHLRDVQLHRDPGPDGDAESAGWHLDASRPQRASRHLRRFITATETALNELLAAPLGELDVVAPMIDGVHFGEHVCVVALGIGIDGTKHPLTLVEGWNGEHHHGHRAARRAARARPGHHQPIFVGIDGAKTLRAAVLRVFDHPVIGRGQLHSIEPSQAPPHRCAKA
jgi:putative transposase